MLNIELPLEIAGVAPSFSRSDEVESSRRDFEQGCSSFVISGGPEC